MKNLIQEALEEEENEEEKEDSDSFEISDLNEDEEEDEFEIGYTLKSELILRAWKRFRPNNGGDE